jgi:F5/8 type C domain-containing protein
MATSYANNSGTGDRRPEINITTDLQSSAGDLGGGVNFSSDDMTVLLDGTTNSGGREMGNANNGADRKLVFDWGVGAETNIVIDEIKIYCQNSTSFGNWTIDGSDDNSSWTNLKASFALALTAAGAAFSFTNTTGYRYYRIHTTSMANAGGGSGFWYEVEFKVDDLSQSTRPSWYNAGGKGARSAFITTSTSGLSISSGVAANLVDGSYTDNSSHALALSGGDNAAQIQFDFGSGASVTINQVSLKSVNTPGNSHGTWKLRGSNNGSTWTDIGSTFALMLVVGTSSITYSRHIVANTTGYRYYRLEQTAGSTSNNPDILEIEFKITGFNIILAKAYKLSAYAALVPISAHAYKLSAYAIINPPAAATAGIVVVIATG